MTTQEIRTTDEFSEILCILTELGKRLPQLRDNPDYLASIPHYLSIGAYKFITAGPRGRLEDQTAFGFVTFYRAPMAQRIVLAVEAFWFEDDRLELQLPVWSFIATLARKMDFHGVCVTERSVNTPGTLHELLKRGELDGDPVGRANILLQADVEGVYSTLTGRPLQQAAFDSSCVRIFTLREQVDFSGLASKEERFFYRGEGRLVNEPYWRFGTPDDLGAWFMERGFSPRGDGDFGGTVQEQILQQGYVNSPTLSLTKSFKVAAYYATSGYSPEVKEAVVFSIEAARLRKYGEIFDSYATMIKHCEWMLESEFQTLRAVVKTLGVLVAGRFLERCNEETRLFVARGLGGARSLVGPVDWNVYFHKDDLGRLRQAGITEGALGGLHDAFESFWMFALGQVGSIDTITIQDEGRHKVVEKPVGPFGYYLAYRQVQDKLVAALEGQTADHRQPGWDLTPFGYIAKTCRDEEFFSSGPIPSDCIVEVTIVNSAGDPARVVASR